MQQRVLWLDAPSANIGLLFLETRLIYFFVFRLEPRSDPVNIYP